MLRVAAVNVRVCRLIAEALSETGRRSDAIREEEMMGGCQRKKDGARDFLLNGN
jgi:hypothetical protein